ncbi:hypothetical protein Swit_1499 [Rhizorhabdus wittichii RW1]|uniref:Uncharacterized protein n=1 Tax=Rhizorhabdus wittichii (strain DSM 6014 / CCUG 31198 / JCM 15750 / NBRC 105917 / EY 4224 / RW1) TaxID=392499 RepID=A0A9J9LBX5_RHIWR|nr:hypothetical protein Swit_1499 [Rhizorhabdus wittichii RW1]
MARRGLGRAVRARCADARRDAARDRPWPWRPAHHRLAAIRRLGRIAAARPRAVDRLRHRCDRRRRADRAAARTGRRAADRDDGRRLADPRHLRVRGERPCGDAAGPARLDLDGRPRVVRPAAAPRRRMAEPRRPARHARACVDAVRRRGAERLGADRARTADAGRPRAGRHRPADGRAGRRSGRGAPHRPARDLCRRGRAMDRRPRRLHLARLPRRARPHAGLHDRLDAADRPADAGAAAASADGAAEGAARRPGALLPDRDPRLSAAGGAAPPRRQRPSRLLSARPGRAATADRRPAGGADRAGEAGGGCRGRHDPGRRPGRRRGDHRQPARRSRPGGRCDDPPRAGRRGGAARPWRRQRGARKRGGVAGLSAPRAGELRARPLRLSVERRHPSPAARRAALRRRLPPDRRGPCRRAVGHGLAAVRAGAMRRGQGVAVSKPSGAREAVAPRRDWHHAIAPCTAPSLGARTPIPCAEKRAGT